MVTDHLERSGMVLLQCSGTKQVTSRGGASVVPGGDPKFPQDRSSLCSKILRLSNHETVLAVPEHHLGSGGTNLPCRCLAGNVAVAVTRS